MNHRLKSVCNLAVTLFTFGSLAGGAYASVITNGDFETGDFTGWSVGITPNYASGGRPYNVDTTGDRWEVSTTTAIQGLSARNGFDGGVVDGSGSALNEADLEFFLSQDFTVIQTISTATLTFDFDITGGPTFAQSRSGAPTEDRVFAVSIMDSLGAEVASLYSYAVAGTTSDSNPLQNVNLDVSSSFSSLGFGTYSLRFLESVPQYFTGAGNFTIDNISLDLQVIPALSSALLLGHCFAAMGLVALLRRI
jgi:hypothetical protein